MAEARHGVEGKPVLSPLQRAWLQEIGMDARMLAHLSTAPFGSDEAPAQQAPTDAARAPAPEARVHPGGMPPASPGVSPAVAQPVADGLSGPVAKRPVERPSSGPAVHVAELLKRASPPVARAAAAAAPTPPEQGASLPPDTGDGTLESLRAYAAGCMACGLHAVRARTVFGEGAESSPQWMFVGEAPGEYDDSTGRPFQGRAGELLQAMLASVGITESAPAYFTNVLKCRPMGNRSPQPDEVAACLPLLRRQIRLLKPRCLVALGRVSAGALLGRSDELDALRGSVHEYVDEDGHAIPLVVTHHPAALLLHAQYKADAWRDLNLLRDVAAANEVSA